MASAEGVRGAYRPDIDGLRAFSVLAVVIFHAWPKMLPGGFIGVDVFFVISGFLISGIIFRSLRAGTFRYTEFYRRRVMRIFPALIVVLAAALPAGWLFLFPEEWQQLGKHLFAGSAFISNIVFMGEGGYFDTAAKPLLHLWSLGIEEQFYIVWPLLLAAAWKWRPARPAFLTLVLASSFALSVRYAGANPAVDFYFPGTRFWELGAGALLAYVTLSRPEPRRWSSAASLAGLALLAASTLVIDETKAFPGVWALLPVAGAVLTLAAGPAAWFNRIVLSFRPVVFVGLISYPLYLWHWPVLVFARMLVPEGSVAPAAVAASIALSALTYKFVETPLRYHRSAIVPWLLSILVAAIGLCGLAGQGGLIPSRLHAARPESVARASGDWDYPFDFNLKRGSGFRHGQVGGSSGERVLFIGDSHAEQYYSRVRAVSEQHRAGFPTTLFATSGGCPPFGGVNRIEPGYACDKFYNYAMALARQPQMRTVVFAAYWEGHFGYGVRRKDDSVLFYRTGEPHQTVQTQRLVDLTFDEFGSSIRSLRMQGKRVFVILSNPASRRYDPNEMVSRLSGSVESRNVERKALNGVRPILDSLASVAAQSGATVIDPVPYLCSGPFCRTTDEQGPIYKDDNHLRSSWAARHATFIDQIYGK